MRAVDVMAVPSEGAGTGVPGCQERRWRRLMLTLTFGATDVATIRFAVSPLWELVASIRVAADPGGHAVHLPWVRRHRSAAATAPVLRTLACGARRRTPGFLAPAPRSPVVEPAAEIDSVRHTPPELVRQDLERVFGAARPLALDALYEDPAAHLPTLADALHGYWQAALEPHWPRLRGLLEHDVVHRARQIADGGPAGVFAALHQDVVWSDGQLRVDLPAFGDTHRLAGRGLVLVPTAFGWPRVHVKAAEPWAPVLRYPARAVGTLWEGTPGGVDLAASLGRTRAHLLSLLDEPLTTTALARISGLAPAGVSAHLHRLRRSGLVTAHRIGRTVAYARTPLAHAWCSRQPDP
ncbi:DUF5937 family protein [Pilimelia columellifera]|uniref:DUF5937 family protein n=1 Tax=Pilimelia columellifera subsp. columellifera TaxID=706583 RepID=A0ABP6B0W9_9ACTN